VDGQGKRRLKTFARKKEADAFEATAKVEVRKGVHVADSASIIVSEAGKLWVTSGESAGLERSTINQRKSHLKNHINPLIGSVLLSKLTVPAIRDFEDQLRQQNRSSAMIRKILTSLGSILSDANEPGLAARNAVRDIRGGRKGKERRSERRMKKRLEVRIDIPSREEIKALVVGLDGDWRPFLITIIFTGMRSSEIRGLRWQDVDFKNEEIMVRQRVDEFGEIGPPKSESGIRSIPIPPIVVNCLKELKLKQGKGTDIIFHNDDNEPVNHSSAIRRGLIPAMIKAGIVIDSGKIASNGDPVMKAKYTGLHSLRHFYASWLINRKEDGGLGLPPKMVQERMGHASIIMTMDVYGHLFPGDDSGDKLANAANALLN